MGFDHPVRNLKVRKNTGLKEVYKIDIQNCTQRCPYPKRDCEHRSFDVYRNVNFL